MLVLTRKQKECIKIGDSITITILRVQGQAVRVGIEAPRDVRVVRGELGSKPDIADADTAMEEALVTCQLPRTGCTANQPSVDDDAPQVVQFRFSPLREAIEKGRATGRGPLAALMSTLQTAGCVAEVATSK